MPRASLYLPILLLSINITLFFLHGSYAFDGLIPFHHDDHYMAGVKRQNSKLECMVGVTDDQCQSVVSFAEYNQMVLLPRC